MARRDHAETIGDLAILAASAFCQYEPCKSGHRISIEKGFNEAILAGVLLRLRMDDSCFLARR